VVGGQQARGLGGARLGQPVGPAVAHPADGDRARRGVDERGDERARRRVRNVGGERAHRVGGRGDGRDHPGCSGDVGGEQRVQRDGGRRV
jgi:hypothetical protein